jgi:hypothetical protein
MNDTESTPPAQKVTKDEIIVAINQICEKRGQPVVKAEEIAELDSVPVGKQAVNDHLDELEEMGRVNLFEYASKGVWWVPDDVESSAAIESSVINWDAIEAEDIPHELLAELPEFQDQTYWESMEDNWGTAAGGAVIVVLLSIFISLVNQNTPLEVGSNVSEVLEIVLVGAIGVFVISFGLVQLARLGQWLEDKGVNDQIRSVLKDAKHGVVRWIQRRLPESEG